MRTCAVERDALDQPDFAFLTGGDDTEIDVLVEIRDDPLRDRARQRVLLVVLSAGDTRRRRAIALVSESGTRGPAGVRNNRHRTWPPSLGPDGTPYAPPS